VPRAPLQNGSIEHSLHGKRIVQAGSGRAQTYPRIFGATSCYFFWNHTIFVSPSVAFTRFCAEISALEESAKGAGVVLLV
jgi:hypothetical protein